MYCGVYEAGEMCKISSIRVSEQNIGLAKIHSHNSFIYVQEILESEGGPKAQSIVINEKSTSSLYDWCQLVYHHVKEECEKEDYYGIRIPIRSYQELLYVCLSQLAVVIVEIESGRENVKEKRKVIVVFVLWYEEEEAWSWKALEVFLSDVNSVSNHVLIHALVFDKDI